MKKLLIGATVTALVLSVGATTAFAAGGRHHGTWAVYNVKQGSGVCQSGYSCFVDANGDGLCDNWGTGSGINYVDANGDGVCDNLGTGCHSQQSWGGGHHGRW